MDAGTRAFVLSRSQNRREYCRSHQNDEPFFRYQIEHIIAKQHGGGENESNLAIACPNCNLHKDTILGAKPRRA